MDMFAEETKSWFELFRWILIFGNVWFLDSILDWLPYWFVLSKLKSIQRLQWTHADGFLFWYFWCWTTEWLWRWVLTLACVTMVWMGFAFDMPSIMTLQHYRGEKKCFVPSRPLLGDGKWWKNCVLIHFLDSNGSKNMCLMCSVFKGPNIWRWSPFVDFLPGLLRGEKQTCARCVIVSRAQPLGDDHLFSERWPSANVACLTLMMRPTSKTRWDKVPKRKFGF